MEYTLPQFNSKADMFKYLKENKALLVSQKKHAVKYADAVCYAVPSAPASDYASKEVAVLMSTPEDVAKSITVKVAINTTNLLDSHGDVHIPGLWKKTLSENKNVLLLREHSMKFENVLAQNVTAYTKRMTWKALGYEYEGSTEVLLFETTIQRKDYTSFMIDRYLEGDVKNHSVGMRYGDLLLCINSEENWYRDEKENWDKYISMVANKEAAEELGYFWAVTTAKVIEGSAVVLGSNFATPTISVQSNKETDEADKVTSEHKEGPAETTPKQSPNYSTIKF